MNLINISSGLTILQATPSSQQQLITMSVIFLVTFGLMRIFITGPEKKKQKQREEMVANLSKGDKIITTSGIHASVKFVKDNVATITLDSNSTMKISLDHILEVVNNQEKTDDKKDKKKTDDKKDSEKIEDKKDNEKTEDEKGN